MASFLLMISLPAGLIPMAGCRDGSENTRLGAATENMVLIPEGEFLMGSEKGGNETERPVHAVFLDAFYIDRYEVTNQDYCDFLNRKGNRKEGGADWINLDGYGCPIDRKDGRFYCAEKYQHFPASFVTWYGAKAFSEWRGKRLPTEAEWEKAARGGRVQKAYPWGDDPPRNQCNWSGMQVHSSGHELLILREGAGLLPVDAFEPNGYGLYNMAGNVSEWCEDWYNKKFYEKSPDRNPLCVLQRYYRVHRGGAFNSVMLLLRCSARNGAPPETGAAIIGFRCALDAGHGKEND